NKKILDIVSPCIAKGRFHPYKGINCHKLFSDVNSELLNVNNFGKDVVFKKKNKSANIETININDVFNPKTKKINDEFVIIPYDLPIDKSNDLIRLFEQYSANKSLSEHKGFVLESGWGYGKFGFLSSVLLSEDKDEIIVRADFGKVYNKSEAELKIIDDIGLDISTL
ncbi:hypothetical protein NOM03_18250, partial [Proteus terrae]|uniref:hypothetical protein n=1 Tax=Proteus terrae TaxID=1574161 RepID=UPI0021AD8305